MKGLILAAGLGTRLRPITSLRPKPIIGVANKPIIVYAIDNLVEAGVTDIGIVVSHDTIDYLKETLASYERARFTYVLQDPPLGLAHAVKVSREFLADDPFVMYLGDNLFEQGVQPFVDAFRPEEGVNAVLALVPVPDPRVFGVAVVEGNRIKDLVEKPKDPPSNLAVAGVYVFDKQVHEVIERLEPGAKGEYQITDAIQMLIDEGKDVAPVTVGGWWKDTGKPEDLLDANRLMLLRIVAQNEGQVEDSELTGAVKVAKGATVRRSSIMGPVAIGEGALIEDAYLGPYTSVGAGAKVREAEIEYSVVEANAVIEAVSTRLHGSLIGTEATVRGNQGRPAGVKLIIGDESKIEL